MSILEVNVESCPSTIDAAALAAAVSEANAAAGSGDETWRSLFSGDLRDAQVEAVQACVRSIAPTCRNLLVLGIGGSGLGARALIEALRPSTWNLWPQKARRGPRCFILENIEPRLVTETLSEIQRDDPGGKHSVLATVSRSGMTAETMALHGLVSDVLDLPAAQHVAITGPEGPLRRIAEAQGGPILSIPEGVGGRFSVLSCVGLFPAAMCGIDIDALLAGAASMDSRCRDEGPASPAATLAAALVSAMGSGRSSQVLMPYATSLGALAAWWVQLWGESLGKVDGDGVRVGPTPMAAIGTTDQHSQLQGWREGPADKIIGIVSAPSIDEGTLPSDMGDEALAWMAGSSLGELSEAQRRATAASLGEADQLVYQIAMPAIDEASLGAFIAMWQIATAIAGRLLGVNAFDQGGVEHGKQLTREFLDAAR